MFRTNRLFKPHNLKRGIRWSTEYDLRWYPGQRFRFRRSNASIVRLLRSRSGQDREKALWIMRQQFRGGTPAIYFDLARPLLADRNNNCRWQAAIVLALFIPYREVDLWHIIEEFGQSKDEDMRACISCVLLEHFLPEHKQYGPRARQLAAASKQFKDTLQTCWRF